MYSHASDIRNILPGPVPCTDARCPVLSVPGFFFYVYFYFYIIRPLTFVFVLLNLESPAVLCPTGCASSKCFPGLPLLIFNCFYRHALVSGLVPVFSGGNL